MVKNFTNINKTNNYFSHQTIEHHKDHDVWKSRSWLGTGKKCGGVKSVNRIPTLTFLCIFLYPLKHTFSSMSKFENHI